jgi:hypothetical protein
MDERGGPKGGKLERLDSATGTDGELHPRKTCEIRQTRLAYPDLCDVLV